MISICCGTTFNNPRAFMPGSTSISFPRCRRALPCFPQASTWRGTKRGFSIIRARGLFYDAQPQTD
jgi:hypothetical protein